jgi:Recombinase
MAALLKLRQAARLIGVSPGKLYRAIDDGRLVAAPGGGPGKPTLVSLEALQVFCRSEGLRVPDEEDVIERSERSISTSARSSHELAPLDTVQTLAARIDQAVERLERSMEQAIDRAVERVVERSPSTATPAIPTRAHMDKAEVLKRIQAMKAAGLSLQAIGNRLNTEGVPTLSGKGRWQKGTIGNLLAQAEDQ